MSDEDDDFPEDTHSKRGKPPHRRAVTCNFDPFEGQAGNRTSGDVNHRNAIIFIDRHDARDGGLYG